MIQEVNRCASTSDDTRGLSELELIHPDVFYYTIGAKGRKRKVGHQQRKERKEKAQILLVPWKQIEEKG